MNNKNKKEKVKHNGDIAFCECPCHYLGSKNEIKECKRGCWVNPNHSNMNNQNKKESKIKSLLREAYLAGQDSVKAIRVIDTGCYRSDGKNANMEMTINEISSKFRKKIITQT